MSVAKTLRTIFDRNDADFIRGLYRELLGYEPSPPIAEYFCRMLALGVPRIIVLAQIAKGEEMAVKLSEEMPPPAGTYPTTWDWVASAFADPLQRKAHYMEFDLPETVIRAPMTGLDPAKDAEMKHFENVPPVPQFVAVVPGGRVWGVGGAVISPDNRVLMDLSIDFSQAYPILHQTGLRPTVYVPETLGVATCSATAFYYHWMIDVLPRFSLLRNSNIPIDRYVVSRGYPMPFQEETLNAIGITKELRIECNSSTHIQAARLVVAPMNGHAGHPQKYAVDFLRDNVMPPLRKPIPGFEYLYICRMNSGHRKLINEHEISGLLQSYGFCRVFPEQLSVAEQAALFAQAKVIVGPHGGGMTNLVFASPGTKVVEFFSPSFINPCYWMIANHVGLDYRYLIGERISPELAAHPFGIVGEPIMVNPGQLERMIETVLRDS
ncbi:glycosyltransferase family 61 protein [Paenibacillus flagellatus]|uniref:Glycosyltransferase 61 catalytic domain-containing protein n=1 Tax=Paenibacillus flagellatus TaxID=2211139 RepID=A0A2V5K3D9_9BACL|nr:glycosyltransferase family 61 protein [Paenibacillus flagellatus]PYI52123.1 hypothetical protein DLM86_21835 [Paenibacillus flagellatus]